MYLQKKNLTKPSDTAEEISNVPSQKFWLDLLKGTIDALSTWLINIDKINNLELDYSNKNSPVDYAKMKVEYSDCFSCGFAKHFQTDALKNQVME